MRESGPSYKVQSSDKYMKYPLDNVQRDNGFQLTEQDEEWITKKKVETVTRKNLEKRLQRQVVLDDGRIIVEDDPEVTNDLIEDHQTHEDDGNENREFGGEFQPVDHYGKGSTVLGERFQRKIHTRDTANKSLTTAAAQNLGEITRQGIEDVTLRGRDVRKVVKPYSKDTNPNQLVIPARIIHKDRSHHRTVDREDVHEVDRMHEGRLKTDRFVTREVVEDDQEETPDEGSSTETESYDGDAQGYTESKEERFIDYYRVPAGRPVTEGHLVRRGIHLTSREKDSKNVPMLTKDKARAIMYDEQSDSPGPYLDKPPRPIRSRKSSNVRQPSSERSFPGKEYASTKKSDDRRFHTIERSEKVQRRRGDRDESHKRHHPPHRQPSMSRRHEQEHQHMRKDLDPERESRLRRAMSFSSGKGTVRSSKSDSSGKGFLDSVKSLYASLKPKKKPVPPPRRHRSSSSQAPSNSLYSSNNGVNSENLNGNRTWTEYSGGNKGNIGRGYTNGVHRRNPAPRRVERRKTMAAFDYDNRDPPKFEPHRHHASTLAINKISKPRDTRSSPERSDSPMRRRADSKIYGSDSGRFFGLDRDEMSTSQRRPAPDMRKLLLNNVNLSRRKSDIREFETRPVVNVN